MDETLPLTSMQELLLDVILSLTYMPYNNEFMALTYIPIPEGVLILYST